MSAFNFSQSYTKQIVQQIVKIGHMKQNEILDSLKAIASVKMSSVGGKKRQITKEQKEYAITAIENWDNVDALTTLRKGIKQNRKFEETEEMLGTLTSRINYLRANATYCDCEGKEIKEGDWLQDLTNPIPGQNVSRVMRDEDGLYVDCDGTSVWLFEIDTLKDTKLVDMVVGADPASPEGDKSVEVQIDQQSEEQPKKVKKTTKASTAQEKKEKGKPGAKPTRKVGDIHKNGKWVWTEYQPGKFDWRTIPSEKKTPGAKKGTAQPKKKAEKKEAPKRKQMSLEEWKQLNKPSGNLSKEQEKARKLLRKGWLIDRTFEECWFVSPEGDKKETCHMPSVAAMFGKYNMSIPEEAYCRCERYPKDTEE